MARPIVLKLGDNNTLTKLTDYNPIKLSNQNDIYYFYANWGNDAVKIKYLPQRFYDLTGKNPVPGFKMYQETDQEVIDATVGEGNVELGWSLFYLPVTSGISGILQSFNNSGYKVSFERLALEVDPNYIGMYATASTDQSTIDLELKAQFPNAEADEYVNVYGTTNNVYVSWVYGQDWIPEDSVLNETLIDSTQTYEETFKGTVFANENYTTDYDPSDLAIQWNHVFSEIAEINDKIAELEVVEAGLMAIDDYDTEGAATKDVKYARNMRTSAGVNESTAEEIREQLDSVSVGDKYISENTTDETLDVKLNDNVTMQLGQEEFLHAVNKTGVTVTNGQVVYLMGASGNTPQIALADNTVKAKAHNTIGIATEDILNNETGFVTIRGLVRGLDTSAYAEGDILYLSTSGTLTNVKPTPPLYNVEVGICVTSNAGAGTIYVGVEKVHEIADSPDVNNDSPSEDDILRYNELGYYEGYDLNNVKFVKTGWDFSKESKLNVAFDDATLTMTLSATEDVDFYIENTKYTLLASTPKTVTITDTEGLWFFYFDGNDTLIASQTMWNIEDTSLTFVAYGYWNATDNEMTLFAYECHTNNMSNSVHRSLHNGVGTVLRSGGVVTQDSDNLNVTAPILLDEDIKITVVDTDTPSAKWEQPLSPLKSHKYYRLGASGLLKKVDDSTTPFYLVGNKVQLNPYTAGEYVLTDMTNNKYGAYWILHTNDISNPVQVYLGQVEADTLNDAQEDNGLASMNFGQLPLQEVVIAFRVIVQQLVTAPYYSIAQIDDFTVDKTLGTPVSAPTSHGSLSGLQDDDHVQYYNDARLNATTGASKVGYDDTNGFTGKTNVQEALDEAKAEINQIVAGELATNSITNDKLVADISIGSNADYQTNTGSTKETVYDALEERIKYETQDDFVERVKTLAKYNRVRFKKTSTTTYEVVVDNGNKHVTYEFIKDVTDDYIKLGKCFVGSIDYALNDKDDASNLTGSWDIASPPFYYATGVGATFECTVIGTRIVFGHRAEDRGGIFEFVVDGDTLNPITISTWALVDSGATPVYDIIKSGLTLGSHTVVGTFKGDDPLHAPDGGVSRGWVHYEPASSTNGSVIGQVSDSNALTKIILDQTSNKEIAINMGYSGTNKWLPEHDTDPVAYNIDEPIFLLDDLEVDVTELTNNEFIEISNFKLIQYNKINYSEYVGVDLARFKTTHLIGIDGIVEYSGEIEALETVTYNIVYPLMLPVPEAGLNSALTSIGNYKVSADDSTDYYFDDETDTTKSFCFIDETDTNYIGAGSIVSSYKTMRIGKDSKPDNPIRFWQRLTGPKLYFQSTLSESIVANDRYTWSGRIVIADINHIYNYLK